MTGRWVPVKLSIVTKVVKCPECKAFVERGQDQTDHMQAHFPEVPEVEYEFAPGVKVGRQWETLREIRNIFRLRPPPEPATYQAEQVSADAEFETRAEAFRAHMESINGPGGGRAAHGS